MMIDKYNFNIGDSAYVIHEGKIRQIAIAGIRETTYKDHSYNGELYSKEFAYDCFPVGADNYQYQLFTVWKPAEQFAKTKEELIDTL